MVCVLLRSKTVWRSVMFAGLLAAVTSPCAAQPLPAYNADIAQTSISGISAGAYMAVQFGTAWSSIIKGVGAIAGGPYGCSEGSLAAALSTCVLGVPRRNLAELIARTNGWSGHGDIDDPANIAAQKIYLFHGYNDQVVARPVSDWLRDFYAHYLNANTTNLFYQTAIGAGHAQVTIAYGSKCADNGGEYINKCRYDQAGIILQHIYGALNPRNDGALTGRLLRFSQADFTAPDEPIDESLNALGFAYVPDACQKQNPCRVHIVLHGCLQSLGYVGNNFVKHAGYNEWADANNLIILYPETDTLPVTIQGITNPEFMLGLVGLSRCRSDGAAHLPAEIRQADPRHQGDARPSDQRRSRQAAGAGRAVAARRTTAAGGTRDGAGAGPQRHRHRSRLVGDPGRRPLRCIPRRPGRRSVQPDRHRLWPELCGCGTAAGDALPLRGAGLVGLRHRPVFPGRVSFHLAAAAALR